PHLGAAQARDRRRPDEPALDARAGIERGAHRELIALAEPALDRVAQAALQFASDEQEGRRAGSGVQVFVRAADGEVRAGTVELDGDRPEEWPAIQKVNASDAGAEGGDGFLVAVGGRREAAGPGGEGGAVGSG